MTTGKIAASILAADFLRLGEQIGAAEDGGADRIHLDVMDGVFVPNISFGLPVVEAAWRATGLSLEAHLMIVQPERYVADFVAAGADTIIVHQEVSPHLDRTLHAIKELGKGAGVAINPATPIETLSEVIELLDLALVMTVNPGFGGQRFIDATLRKVSRLRAILDERNPGCDLEVDGGIDPATIGRAWEAGATVFVAGTAVFGHRKGAAKGVRSLLDELSVRAK
jgi:ribulose-phosphate 3-epimerase